MKLQNLSPRVLVVDSQPAIISALQIQLNSMGLRIYIDGASTIEEAKKLVRLNCHHYALVSLHIEQADKPDGPCLLEDIRAHWPEAFRDCFALYTYKDVDEFTIVKNALNDRFFVKNNVEATADWLIEHVRNRQAGGYNWGIGIYLDETACNIDETFIVDIEDALRQLFDGKNNLSVSKLSEQGYSGAVLLQASQTSKNFEPRQFVLKFGKADAVQREQGNVEKFVRSSSFSCAPHMEKTAYNRARTQGMIKFDTVESALTLDRKIELARSEEDIKKCQRYLKVAINAMMQAWYSHPTWISGPTPSDFLHEKFEEYAHDNLGAVYEALEAQKYGGKKISVNVSNVELILRDVAAHIPPSLGTNIKVPQLIAHNDFHTKNILISDKSETVFIIDFARTNDGMHAYSDFAKMEAHIAADLMLGRVFKSDLLGYIDIITQLYSKESFINFEGSFNSVVSASKLTFLGRGYVEMLRETRSGWLRLLNKIDYPATESLKLQWKHYVYAIVLELIQSLWWIKSKKEYTNMHRASVLYLISMLLDVNSGRTETSYAHGG